MKIKGQYHLSPPPVISSLGARIVDACGHENESKATTIAQLGEVCENFTCYDEPTEMQHWIGPLNSLDKCLEDVLRRESIACVHFVVGGPVDKDKGKDKTESPGPSSSQPQSDDAASADANLVKAVLRITRLLLENTINKAIYNSTPHLLRLLSAYDDEIAFLALEVLVALALPPNACRCLVENITRHSTQIHKHSSYAIPFFEIIECARAVLPSLPIQDVVEDSLQLQQSDADTISLDVAALAAIKTGGMAGPLPPPSSPRADADTTTGSKMCKTLISGIQAMPLPTLVAQVKDSAQVSDTYLFALVWMARMKKMLYSASGRVAIIASLYQSVAVLLCCHPDPSVLSGFFLDKSDLLRDFVYLVRTGPGSNEYRPEQVPFSLRVLSCSCLRAIVGSRESGVSILGRFSGSPLILYSFL